MITQGAGGNTSIKDGQQLIIKASGTHLRKALEQDIFIAIDLPELRAAIAKGREYDFNANLTQTGRGSIETPLHAAIDQRVVIHVHSVRALSFALRIDGLKDLERLLSGLSWTWVPYAKPGWPLTWELLRVSAPETNVWILQNHGVIVAADSCDEALALLWEVERRLDSGSVQSADLDQQSLAHLEEVVRGSCWRVPNGIEAHLLASQQGSRELIGAGVVCPDQAVFLGSNIPIVDNFKLYRSGLLQRLC
jgi:rhamnose utilization protein RhaD (predicted bifunctional aldolase and dehydrogenase)